MASATAPTLRSADAARLMPKPNRAPRGLGEVEQVVLAGPQDAGALELG
jgi:hypothetical protein